MVHPVGEFFLGATVIIAPQFRLQLLAGTAAFKFGKSILGRSKRRNGAPGKGAVQNGSEQQLTLEWDQLSVAIANKKSGKTRTIFNGLEGSARPGRWATFSTMFMPGTSSC